jgi:hypothetical protein
LIDTESTSAIRGSVTSFRWQDLRFASALYSNGDSAQESYELEGNAEVRGKTASFRLTFTSFPAHEQEELTLGEAEEWVTVAEYRRIREALVGLARQLGAILKGRTAVIAEEGFDRNYQTGAYTSSRERPFSA